MRIAKSLITTVIFLMSYCGIYAQINVLPNQTAQALAQKLAGQGVTILNTTLNCPGNANGFFNVVSSNIGLDSGIVLTNGQAATEDKTYGVNGPASYLASTDNRVPGDTELQALAGQATFDACELEFDVVPSGDTVKFNYLFSSEEYTNGVCYKYNDVFAFFISGPGISGSENMALVPGTNIPVTINSINDGVPSSGGNISTCNAMGPGSPFTSFYVDNSNGSTLTHKGFTSVLTAAHAVIPCSTYHLKLAIVDAWDATYDSGVFLEAGSLQTTDYHVDALAVPIKDTISPVCIKGCQAGTFVVKSSQISSAPQTMHFVMGGTAIAGIDYISLPDSIVIPAGNLSANIGITGLATPLNGAKSLVLYLLPVNNCESVNTFIDSATLLIYDTPYVYIHPADTQICGNDTLEIHVSADSICNFSWQPGGFINDSTLQNILVYPSTYMVYTLTASLPGTTCATKSATTSIAIKTTPQLLLPADTEVCYHNTLILDPVIENPNIYYSYQWSGPQNFTSTTNQITIDTVTNLQQGKYTLIVTNDTNHCKTLTQVNVLTNIPEQPVAVSPQQFCYNTSPTALIAQGQHLLWYSGESQDSGNTAPPVIPTSFPENFQYYVTQTIDGCESPKLPVLAEVELCCNGNVFIPNAFAPNSAGINSTFHIFPDFGYSIKSCMIFNRWGQLVYNNTAATWDGTFQQSTAETGTYFYQVVLGCVLGGEVHLEGDVTLIR